MATENMVEWRRKVGAHVVLLSVPKCRSQRSRREDEHGEAAGRATRRIGRRGHPGAGMLHGASFVRHVRQAIVGACSQ